MQLDTVSTSLLLAVVAASACAVSPPPPASDVAARPDGATTAAPLPDAGPPPVAAPSADAAPPTACAPVDQAEVAAPFRPLFEKGRGFRYFVTDDVDPHAPDGKRSVTRTNVDCTVTALCRFPSGVVASELPCASDAGAALPDRLVFLARQDALWMTTSLPADEPAAARAVAEPPIARKSPASSRRTYDQPGMHDGTRDRCTEVITASAAQSCRDTRCAVQAGYGPTQDDACVTPNRGLTSWRRVNLAGPRTTSWVLLDTRAP